VYDEYLTYYRDALKCLREAEDSNAGYDMNFVRGMGLAVYEAAVRYLEENEAQYKAESEEPVAKRAMGGN
jgi:hypothetical protein